MSVTALSSAVITQRIENAKQAASVRSGKAERAPSFPSHSASANADAQASVAVASQAQTARELTSHSSPLSSAVEGVIDAFGGGHERFTLGLSKIDVLTRGFGEKELVFFSGFSHAGKTQLVNTMLFHNRDKRVIFFSLDDPAEMILLKLASMTLNVSGDDLERELREGKMHTELREVAAGHFKHLHVIDESLSLEGMSEAVAEISRVYGTPDAVVMDYLSLIPGVHAEGYDNIARKSQALKAWVKDKPFPTIVVHQGSRANARPGERMNILSMSYGGEQEGTMVLGVRRKRDDLSATDWERERHADTVTIHLIKNKRAPSKTTRPAGIDFYLDPNTGLIGPLPDESLDYASDPGEEAARKEAAR